MRSFQSHSQFYTYQKPRKCDHDLSTDRVVCRRTVIQKVTPAKKNFTYTLSYTHNCKCFYECYMFYYYIVNRIDQRGVLWVQYGWGRSINRTSSRLGVFAGSMILGCGIGREEVARDVQHNVIVQRH